MFYGGSWWENVAGRFDSAEFWDELEISHIVKKFV